MGLHGGINILHQKKWHVYNADNRAIVQRDEENHERSERSKHRHKQNTALHHRLSKLAERHGGPDRNESTRRQEGRTKPEEVVFKPLDDEDQYERVLKKRLRGDDEETSKFANKERYKNERGGASGRWLDKGAKKTYEKDYGKVENDAALPSVGGPQNINLFQDVEREREKRVKQHEQYLKDVGHDKDKDVSYFAKLAEEEKTKAWYLRDSDYRRNEIASFQRRGSKKLQDQKTFFVRRSGHKSKEQELDERTRQLKMRDILDSVKNQSSGGLGTTSKLDSTGYLLKDFTTMGSLSVAATDQEQEKFQEELTRSADEHRAIISRHEQEILNREIDEKNSQIEADTYHDRQHSLAQSSNTDLNINRRGMDRSGRRWSSPNRVANNGSRRMRSGMLSFDQPHEVPLRSSDRPVENKTKSLLKPKDPPVPPVGHSGWAETDGDMVGPKSVTEEEWPRLLPRDYDHQKEMRKRVKHRRRYLDSDSG